MKAILLALLLAQNDTWMSFSDNVAIQQGTILRNQAISTVVIRIRTQAQVSVYHALVRNEDCRFGYGTVYFHNITTREAENFTWQFAFGSGNVASGVAQFLCTAQQMNYNGKREPQVQLKNEQGLAADDAADDNDYDDARS